jgi:hypothetical protein
MSRSELATLVNALLFGPDKARFGSFNANYVGKLERGEIHWPQDQYRAALRHILKADADEDLGFYDPQAHHVEGAQMLGHPAPSTTADVMLAAVSLGQPSIDLLGSSDVEMPRWISREHIDTIAELANMFEQWDNSRGGSVAREIADQTLRQSARLLTVTCPKTLRPALHTASAQLAGVVGFMLFDAYEHDDARRRFAFALQCSAIGGNWHQRAMLLSSMARQAIWCGHPDEGLTCVEMGLVRADRLTATERAMLHTVRARALAKMGASRAQDALTAVGMADEEFAHCDPAEDPEWMRFYDSAQHHGDTAHALFDVEMSIMLATEAASRFTHSVSHHQAEFARSKAISGTKLATLTMVRGDPREASMTGHQALDDAGPVRSRRAADDLRALYRATDRHAGIDEVDALRDRIRTTVGVAA